MAYAAVISVFNAIHDVLESPRVSITPSTRQILLYAKDQVWFRDILSQKWCGELVAASDDERKMIDEARSLQDAIEFAVYTQSLHQSGIPFSLNLDHLKKDVDRFAEMAKEMKGRIDELWEQNAAMVIEQHIMEIFQHLQKEEIEEEDISASAATEMVGLCDEFRKIRDILAPPSDTSERHWQTYYWISGMAGVGKTTIAERVYRDPSVRANFECWAFVRVGREYWTEQILRSLHAQLNRGDNKMRMWGGDNLEDLRRSIHETLRVKKFLIVLDDVWDHYVVQDLIDQFYKYLGMGNRILVTSRMEPDYPFDHHCLKLRFLNVDESWELLKRKVFVEEGGVCPHELVEPGKKIAKKCEGLPLLINALAPLLLEKADKNPKSWNRLAEKTSSLLEAASLQISEVLLTSYNNIDEIHKLCFLYIAAFPQSYVVFCSAINNLWRAEGFYDIITSVPISYAKSSAFYVLLENNLATLDHKESWSSEEFKACSLHCAYWYVNKRVAKDNRFLYIMNSYADGMDEVVRSHHRLAIQTNVLLAIEEVFDNISSISTIRSLLCTGHYHKYQVPICCDWKLLRVLDAVTIRFYEFPIEVVKLVLLRYLALTCNANLPSSISKLWKLEFLIVRQHRKIKRIAVESFVPVEIWDLQELIHLEIMGRNLPEPPHPDVVLPKLKKLIDVGVESCTKGVLSNIPKLKKLRIQIELAPNSPEYWTCFFNVKSFQCMVMNPTLSCPPPPLSDAIFLRIEKLSLSGFGYPWEEMSKIAKLPELRVLKLRSYAFQGEKWEVNESFSLLEFLHIEDTDLMHWTATEDGHLDLVCLKMENCYKLHEIPKLRIYENTKIELIDCNPLAETCIKQRYSGDDLALITATYSWKGKKL